MCLNTLTKKYARPSRKVVKAWKIVELRADGKYETPYQYTLMTYTWMKAEKPAIPLRTEEWIPDAFCLHASTDRVEYPWGFHSFATQQDAQNALENLTTSYNRYVVAVEITDIVAEGTDGTSGGREFPRHFNYVSRKMRLLI